MLPQLLQVFPIAFPQQADRALAMPAKDVAAPVVWAHDVRRFQADRGHYRDQCASGRPGRADNVEPIVLNRMQRADMSDALGTAAFENRKDRPRLGRTRLCWRLEFSHVKP